MHSQETDILECQSDVHNLPCTNHSNRAKSVYKFSHNGIFCLSNNCIIDELWPDPWIQISFNSNIEEVMRG